MTYTCLRCGWSGLEPKFRSFDHTTLHYGDSSEYYGPGIARPGHGATFETGSYGTYAKCPECPGLVQTESQREQQKWEGRFVGGMLVVMVIMLITGNV